MTQYPPYAEFPSNIIKDEIRDYFGCNMGII